MATLPLIYGGSIDSVARADQFRAQLAQQQAAQSHEMLRQAAAMVQQQQQNQRQQRMDEERFAFDQERDVRDFKAQQRRQAIMDVQAQHDRFMKEREMDLRESQLKRFQEQDRLRFVEEGERKRAQAEADREARLEIAALQRSRIQQEREQADLARMLQRENDQVAQVERNITSYSPSELRNIADTMTDARNRARMMALFDASIAENRELRKQSTEYANQANAQIRSAREEMLQKGKEHQRGDWMVGMLPRFMGGYKKSVEAFEQAVRSAQNTSTAPGMIRFDRASQQFVPAYPDPDAEMARLSEARQRPQQQPSDPQMLGFGSDYQHPGFSGWQSTPLFQGQQQEQTLPVDQPVPQRSGWGNDQPPMIPPRIPNDFGPITGGDLGIYEGGPGITLPSGQSMPLAAEAGTLPFGMSMEGKADLLSQEDMVEWSQIVDRLMQMRDAQGNQLHDEQTAEALAVREIFRRKGWIY